MSRSYKKNPYVTDGYGGDRKTSKRIANRKVRRIVRSMGEDMPTRIQHKKMTCTWDICDYRWRMTREDAIHWYENEMANEASDYFKKRYPTLEAWLKYWDKCYRRK